MRIVEIGPSFNPVYHYSGRVRDLLGRGGNSYVGIDLGLTELRRINEEGFGIGVLGDLGKIPLAHRVADEVWVNNVFGGNLQNKLDKLPDGSLIQTLGITRYFEEITRILKPGGVIYIGEWCPRIREVEWLADHVFTGYGVRKKVYKEDRLGDFISQHGFRLGTTWKDVTPFFLELRKPLQMVA